MKKNIIFDFGAVLIDWNPHYLYDPYFGDSKKTDWFLENICTMEWNTQMDGGKPFAQGIAERAALFPEWKKEIELYHSGWTKMVGGEIPGSLALVKELKTMGFHLYGLSNWSSETFPFVEHRFPALDLLEGKVVSGFEGVVKPDPKIYGILLERFSLNAKECVFVDDNPANIAGSEAAGIDGILFKSASQVRNDLGLL